MDIGIIYKRKRSLIIAQIIGFVFGIVLAISGGYETFWEIVGAIVLGPIASAALLRFCVRAYQFAKVKFGVKIPDSNGDCVVIEKPGRGILFAIAAPFLLIASISLFFATAPQWLRNGYIILLVLIGTFFCFLDIRYIVKHKQARKQL